MNLQRYSSEKHLDYNVPLLSVRRLNEYSAVNGRANGVIQKPYKLSAELSAESLRKPGAVPFLWEQIPGKPKNKDDGEITSLSSPTPLSAPSGLVHDGSMNHSNGNDSFVYSESQIALDDNRDGDVKEDVGSSPDCSDEGSFLILLPQREKERLILHSEFPAAAPAFSEINHMHSRRRAFAEETRTRVVNSAHFQSENYDSISEATDTVTPTEAVATTCRVSMDGFDGNQMVSQTGREARDFIMHRFLPAAKAMACDSPANSGRRPSQEISKAIINGRASRGPLPLTPRPPPRPAKGRLPLPDKEETEDASKKVCGLFPVRFRTAFLHLNRIPRTSYRAKMKKESSSLSGPGKLRTVIHQDTSSGSDDEEVVVREVQASLYERRAQTKASGSYTTGLQGNAGNFKGNCSSYQHASEGGETPNSKLVYYDAASRFSPQTTDRSRGSCFSPYRNDMSPFYESKRSGLLKQCSDAVIYVDAASSCFETPRASVGGEGYFSRESSRSPVSRGNKFSSLAVSGSEKVVCVDTTVELNGIMNDSVTERATATQEHSNNRNYLHAQDTYFDQHGDPGGSERAESFRVQDTSSASNELRTSELHSACCSDTLFSDEWLIPEPRGWPLGMPGKFFDSPGKPSQQKRWMERDSSISVLSPPLPKAPSESWLWRALPLKTPNRSPMSNLLVPASGVARKQLDPSTMQAKVPNWESIVKGDHVQPG